MSLIPAIRPIVRSVPWGHVAGGAVAASVVTALAGMRDASPDARLFAVRASALVLATAVAFALDDDAAPTLASSPTPLAVRRGIRTALALCTFALLWLAATAVWLGADLPLAAAVLEAAAMLAFTVAVSVTASTGAMVAGPVLALFLVGTFMLSVRWPRIFTMLTVPGGPHWRASHVRWAALLLVSAAVVWWSARDPARRRCTIAWHGLGPQRARPVPGAVRVDRLPGGGEQRRPR